MIIDLSKLWEFSWFEFDTETHAYVIFQYDGKWAVNVFRPETVGSGISQVYDSTEIAHSIGAALVVLGELIDNQI